MARLMPLLSALLLAALPAAAEAAQVRVTCRGVQQLSTTERAVSCHETDAFTDRDGRILFGHTAAAADLANGTLTASASGGSIRDIGYNGGEATALLKDEIPVPGEWRGSIPVTVTMRIAYRFAGFGESRIHASLSATSAPGPSARHRALIRLSHRGFDQVSLRSVAGDGSYAVPADGAYPSRAVLTMSVTEMVAASSPRVTVRARLDGYALPNLDSVNPSADSLVDAEARITVSLAEEDTRPTAGGAEAAYSPAPAR